MGLASVVLGVVSFLLLFAGMLLSWLPGAGAILSFGAPIAALAGIVLGAVGMSRAKQADEPTGLPLAGIIVSAIAFFPAVLIAISCGLCNACATASMLDPNARRHWGNDGGSGLYVSYGDGGVYPWTTPPQQGVPQGNPGATPPPAFPPPPMPEPAVEPSAPDEPSAMPEDPAAPPAPGDPLAPPR